MPRQAMPRGNHKDMEREKYENARVGNLCLNRMTGL